MSLWERAFYDQAHLSLQAIHGFIGRLELYLDRELVARLLSVPRFLHDFLGRTHFLTPQPIYTTQTILLHLSVSGRIRLRISYRVHLVSLRLNDLIFF